MYRLVPVNPIARVPAILLAGVLLVQASPAGARGPKAAAPEPPALPAATDALGLRESLGPEARAALDDAQGVVTFGQVEKDAGDGVELLAVSLGTLRVPPEGLRALLAKIGDYPTWVTLQPSYKRVRIQGASRMIADVGSAESPKAKRTMTYDVETSGATTTWRVVESRTSLRRGSSVSFEIAPHPSLADASLIVHRQLGLLPKGDRMTSYLAADDDKGRDRWWKDANRHARRLHWAMDAALRFPPGGDRNGHYVENYQREFMGKIPWWAAR